MRAIAPRAAPTVSQVGVNAMTRFETYKAARGPIPRRMLKWHLYGQGLDNLHVEEADVPQFGPDELLVRQDACGLCFSDTKVIALGPDHPRMVGRDMTKNPVTLGHEVACTVVGVGANRKDKFAIGDRFLVQADVFYKGVSMAYGYVFSGGLAEYSIIPKQMIDGDEGCYLLPISKDAGYAAIALVEPWSCVVSAYTQGHRAGLKAGGNLLIIAEHPADWVDWSGAFDGGEPASVYVVASSNARGCVPASLAARATMVDTVKDWAQVRAFTKDAGFDDIIVLGEVAPETIEGAATTFANHGIMNLLGAYELPRKLSIDIGRIHYNWHHYLGNKGARVMDSYAEPRDADLHQGGCAWFIGAGGPMGQMHVQRAVMHPRPPRRIVATDIDDERLGSVVDRFSGVAKERGVDLVAINPKNMSQDEFNAELNRLSENRGFDDIVSLVPVSALIEHAAGFLADGGWFNVFAGVARGTMANLCLNAVRNRGVRYVGSSGSSLNDMRQTLAKVESGELSTNASLAAIGGMRTAKEGLAAVKSGRFPGKTLVFPRLTDMPLMALSDLKEKYPTVHAKLKDGKFWTQEAEQELLSLLAPEE